MEGILEFLIKTGVVAGCTLVNTAVNIGAAKIVDKNMVAEVPERTPEMTDEQYVEACQKADRTNKIKKNIVKGTVGVISLLGTSAGCSVALGAIEGAGAGSVETTVDTDAGEVTVTEF